MKKGLLSILALAVTIVGCQNYDDQFDALNTQITALKSQVDGLAAVQSAVTALQGQLSSLASSALTSADLDSALSSGLADIIADVEALETSLADVASGADVEAVSDAVSDAQADLDELLAQSSVFTGDVNVNSVSTLDAFHSMGSGLNIVNGNVDIDITADMDMTKVQELVDNFLTVIKDVDYTSNANTTAEVIFNNLTGVQTLTIKQGGGIQFPELVSAEKIVLDDTWKSTITMIDFRKLNAVGTLITGSTSHKVSFNKAEEMHFTALPRYGSAIEFETKKGGVLDITNLRDVDSDGDQSALALTITGPATVNISELDGEDGTITLKDVETATVDNWDGIIAVTDGVITFSSNNAVDITGSTWVDTETITIKGVVDPNHTGSTADQGPAFNYTSNLSDLITLNMTGTFASVVLENQASLETLILAADVTGAIDLDSNSDLATVTLTGSKATGITVEDCDDLTGLTIDITMRGTAAAATTINGTIKVTGNEDLESLIVSAPTNNIRTLNVTSNTNLERVNFTGVNATGSTAKADVDIYSNKLEASVAQDKTNATGCTSCGDGEANDKGAFTTESGMDTLEDYLAAVIADTGSNAKVYFDTVESITNASGVEQSSNKTYAANADDVRVLVLTPADITAGKTDKLHKRAYVVEGASGQGLSFEINGLQVFDSSRGDVDAGGDLALTGNQTLDLAAITASAHVTRAASEDVTLTAAAGGNGQITVTFTMVTASTSTATAAGERYAFGNNSALETVVSNTAGTVSTVLGADDYVTLSVGSLSATGTGKTAGQLADALVTAWNTKYGQAGKGSSSVVFSATSISTGSINIFAVDKGSASHNQAVTVAVTQGTTDTSTNGEGLEFTRGATTSSSDNSTDSDAVIVYLESKTALPLADPLRGANLTVSSNVTTALTTTLTQNGATAGGTKYFYAAKEAREDCRLPEQGTADVTNSAAVNYTRVHWFGS